MRKYIFPVFFFFLVANAAVSQKITISPEPGWLYRVAAGEPKKPAAKEITSGYYLEQLDRQVNIASQTEYNHFTRVIVNETGVQRASEVSVSFSPGYQQLVFHKLSLVRNGKEVSKVNPSAFKIVQEETDAEDYQYNGMKRAFVVLKDVRSDDRIEVSYSLVGFNPVYANKFTSELYFTSGIAIGNYTESVLAPAGRALNIRAVNGAPEPEKIVQANTIIYRWSNPALQPGGSQPGTPIWYNTYPYVSITEYRNWKELNDWGLGLFNNYNVPLSPALKSKIAEFKKEAGDNDRVYASLATKFVQDKIRYLGMEIGIYTHRPHLPSEVFAQRYGDCKDKAFLLAMMLREGGIKAYVALASTELRGTLTQHEASPYKFNHAIVAAELGTDYKFIDATISYQRGRFEDLYIPDYGAALVIREGTDALSLFRFGNIKQTNILEKLYVSERNGENSLLEAKTVYEGGSADNTRSNIADYGMADLEDSYRKFYARLYDSVIFKNEVYINDDSLNDRITIEEAYRIPNIWHIDDAGKEQLNLYAHFLSDILPDPSTSYKYGPLALPYPQDIQYTLEVNLPGNWTFPSDSYHISNGSYEFDFKLHRNGKQVTLEYHFKTFKDHIPYEEVARYKSDYKKIAGLVNYTLPKNGSSAGGATGVLRVNFITVSLAILILALLLFAFRKLNRTSAEAHYIAGTGRKLGGWLIVLGFSLVLQLCMNAYTFYEENIFDRNVWDNLGALAGFGLQSVLLAELLALLLLIGGCLAVLYWFAKRRDIFPKMFVGFVIVNGACQLFLIAVYAFAPLPESLRNLNADAPAKITRMIIYAAVWVSYIYRSERVKETFIEPYAYVYADTPVEESSGADEPTPTPDTGTAHEAGELPPPGNDAKQGEGSPGAYSL